MYPIDFRDLPGWFLTVQTVPTIVPLNRSPLTVQYVRKPDPDVLPVNHNLSPLKRIRLMLLAEGKRFELLRGYPLLVFETSALIHSANLPCFVQFDKILSVPLLNILKHRLHFWCI